MAIRGHLVQAFRYASQRMTSHHLRHPCEYTDGQYIYDLPGMRIYVVRSNNRTCSLSWSFVLEDSPTQRWRPRIGLRAASGRRHDASRGKRAGKRRSFQVLSTSSVYHRCFDQMVTMRSSTRDCLSNGTCRAVYVDLHMIQNPHVVCALRSRSSVDAPMPLGLLSQD